MSIEQIDQKRMAILEKTLKSFYGEKYSIDVFNINLFNSESKTVEESKSVLLSTLSPKGLPPTVVAVTINFDEIPMKNHFGLVHIVKDVYVRFFLTGHTLTLISIGGTDFCGLRGSASVREINSGYIHSHPGGYRDIFRWSVFCPGTGPINESKNHLAETFSELYLKSYLIDAKAYLEWEETGYDYVRNVKVILKGIDSVQIKMEPEEICSLIKSAKICRKDFVTSFSNDTFVVEPLPSMEIKLGIACKKEHKCIRTHKGNYLRTGEDPVLREKLPGHSLLKFRGKDVFAKQIDSFETIPGFESVVANPSVTKIVCKLLEEKLNKKVLTKNGNHERNRILRKSHEG